MAWLGLAWLLLDRLRRVVGRDTSKVVNEYLSFFLSFFLFVLLVLVCVCSGPDVAAAPLVPAESMHVEYGTLECAVREFFIRGLVHVHTYRQTDRQTRTALDSTL